MQTEEREYLLVGKTGDTRALAAGVLETTEFREGDRVLGFPSGMSPSDRELALKIVRRRVFVARSRHAALKKLNVEYHRAYSDSWRMSFAEGLHAVSAVMLLKTRSLAAILVVCNVALIHMLTPGPEATKRVLLTPEKTYLSFAIETKVKDEAEVDIEAEKKNAEEYKAWREGKSVDER
ncbi:hypothetical protein OIU34_16555 [Pararhizobium sp. BT-229]|uniref:hypothetical protein n=1 Tax=Pararhizobium sp. BT-229 TaxID=2986923 RepID=UPI0021F71F5B|nr:hypothetical protein [Pararhizobium sp. BT-229]MCV9963515.1 hypothetical protein [Pararhizobium sp. BT-229]